jgi:hypothetical protein
MPYFKSKKPGVDLVSAACTAEESEKSTPKMFWVSGAVFINKQKICSNSNTQHLLIFFRARLTRLARQICSGKSKSTDFFTKLNWHIFCNQAIGLVNSAETIER